MQKDKTIKFLDFALEVTWLLIIGLGPIFFTTLLYAVWQLSEYFLFQFLVELAVLLWLLKMLFLWQKGSFFYFKEFILKRIKFAWPAFVFISILGLATIFSPARTLSFFGSYFRRLGYLTWLHFFFFFILLIFNLKNLSQVKRILIVILLAVFVATFYGFVQILGFEPFFWQEPAVYTGRIFSTLGQPNFYGAWLILTIPLTLFALNLWRKNFILKSFIWLLVITSFFNLSLTLSRSSWLGFLASFIFFLIASLFLAKKRFLAFTFLGIIFLGLVLLFYLNFFKPLNLAGNFFLNRIISLSRLTVEGRIRLITWQSSLDLISKSPFLGYGPDNLQNQFVSYYRPENAIYEAINSYPDRAHNEILDIALISGLLGLASYLFLLIFTFYLGLKTQLADYQNTQMPTCLLAALFGYFIVNQFSFHVIPTLIYFWLYLALIIFVFLSSKKLDLPPKESSLKKYSKIQLSFFGSKVQQTTIFSLIFLSIFSIGLLSFEVNFRPFLADYFFKQALLARINNNWPDTLRNYQKAITFLPNESYYRQRFAMDLMWAATDFYHDKENKIKILKIAYRYAESIPSQERNFETRAYQAKILALQADLNQKEEDFDLAEKAYEKIASFSPLMAGLYNDWCQLEIYKKDWSAAFEKCEKALSLYPALNHPHLNEHHRQMIIAEKSQVWQKMAYLNLQEKKYEETEKYYRKILKYQPFRSDVYKYLADLYYLQKNLDEAIRLNSHAYVLNPKDPALSYGLAILYKEKKDFEQARFWAEKTLALNPVESEEIKQFLRGLK